MLTDLYLRMFHTERLLGWNSEEWFSYLTTSLLAAIVLVSLLAAFRYSIPGLEPYLGIEIIVVSCSICLPLVILLYFASGRVSIQPQASSVQRMDNFGCCGQGLVYTREMAQKLVPYYQQEKLAFADTLTDRYASEHRLARWAIKPSVLQHVGHKSSKESGIDVESIDDLNKKTVAEEIRSWSFEKQDPQKLRSEHEEAARQLYAWEAML
jgi:hypothetical protein